MMNLNTILYLGLVLFLVYFIKLLFSKIKLPEVTGYVLLGVILGVSLLNFLNHDVLKRFESMSSIALGIIAFIIGIELRWDNIRKLGKPIIFIVILESFGGFLTVFLVMLPIFHGDFSYPLLLGSVAAATAPAATVAVIRQYKAKGTLTSTIMAVVGIDDAVALIIFVFASSFVKAFLSHAEVHGGIILLKALLSLALSLGIGGAFAFIYTFILKKIKNNEMIEVLVVAMVLLQIGICEQFKLSELLSIMFFGALVVNLSPALALRSETIVQYFSPVFLSVFFIFGGAHLDIKLIAQIGLIGLAYFGARTAGKIGGAQLGAALGKAPPTVKKYIGFALLPQVGVALALALAINKDFNIPAYGAEGKNLATVVINILLFTTIITEVVGPILTRHVLHKSGEIELTKTEGR